MAKSSLPIGKKYDICAVILKNTKMIRQRIYIDTKEKLN